jgi:ParB-like chromosome segregation protein Spo0J
MGEPIKQDYTFHKLSLIFPEMRHAQYKALVEDIKKRGLREPIVLFEGEILDGRHRYLACKEAGYQFGKADITEFKDDDPIAYIVSYNLHRRHLTENQRAVVAARISTLRHGANQHRKEGSSIELSSALHVSEASMKRAKAVLDNGVPELVQMVEQHKIKASAVQELVKRPVEEQRAILAKKGKEFKAAMVALNPPNQSDIYDGIEAKLLAQLNNLTTDARSAAATKTVEKLRGYIALAA